MTLVRARFLGSSCSRRRERSKDDVRLANATSLFLNTLMSFKHLTYVAKAQQKAESVRKRKWGRQNNCLGGTEVLSPPQKRKEKVYWGETPLPGDWDTVRNKGHAFAK